MYPGVLIKKHYQLTIVAFLVFALSCIPQVLTLSFVMRSHEPTLAPVFSYLEWHVLVASCAIHAWISIVLGPLFDLMLVEILTIAGSLLFLFCSHLQEYQMAVTVLMLGVGGGLMSCISVAHTVLWAEEPGLSWVTAVVAFIAIGTQYLVQHFLNFEHLPLEYWVLGLQLVGLGMIGCFIWTNTLARSRSLKRLIIQHSFQTKAHQVRSTPFYLSMFFNMMAVMVLALMVYFFEHIYIHWTEQLDFTYDRLTALFRFFPLLISAVVAWKYYHHDEIFDFIRSDLKTLSFISLIAALTCSYGAIYYPFFSPLMILSLCIIYAVQLILVCESTKNILIESRASILYYIAMLQAVGYVLGHCSYQKYLIQTHTYVFYCFIALLCLQSLMLLVDKADLLSQNSVGE